MKRTIEFFIMFFCFSGLFSQSCFKLSHEESRKAEEIPVKRNFTKSEVFLPFTDMTVSGIGISGQITVLTEDFLVRVIVTDKAGEDYLLLESYDEIFDSSMTSFVDYAEETLSLNNVSPASIKVIVKKRCLGTSVYQMCAIQKTNKYSRNTNSSISEKRANTATEEM